MTAKEFFGSLLFFALLFACLWLCGCQSPPVIGIRYDEHGQFYAEKFEYRDPWRTAP